MKSVCKPSIQNRTKQNKTKQNEFEQTKGEIYEETKKKKESRLQEHHRLSFPFALCVRTLMLNDVENKRGEMRKWRKLQ